MGGLITDLGEPCNREEGQQVILFGQVLKATLGVFAPSSEDLPRSQMVINNE